MMRPSSRVRSTPWPPSSWGSTSTGAACSPWPQASLWGGAWGQWVGTAGAAGTRGKGIHKQGGGWRLVCAHPPNSKHKKAPHQLPSWPTPNPAAVRQLRGEAGGDGGGAGAGAVGAPLDLSFSEPEPADVEARYVAALEELALGDFDSSAPRAYNRSFAAKAERTEGDTSGALSRCCDWGVVARACGLRAAAPEDTRQAAASGPASVSQAIACLPASPLPAPCSQAQGSG